MGLIRDFREFALKGNVIDLAVGVIIGVAFGKIVGSLVEDIIMPPIGKLIGDIDFSNLYISLSDKVDAANNALASTRASGMLDAFSSTGRIALVDARKLGPVLAYGNFITILINFIILAFCIFLLVKIVAFTMRKQAAKEAAAPTPPSAEAVLLSEIRDMMKQKDSAQKLL